MITFEKIRDLERGEKESKLLQKLPENLASEISEYLSRKRQLKEEAGSDIAEVKSIETVLKNFFEVRERKLLDQLLYSVRSGSRPENMTKDESEMFEKIYKHMKSYRESFFSSVSGSVLHAKADSGESQRKKYKVLQDMPEFVGPDMSVYSLKKGQETGLPESLASLLLKKGIVREK